MRSTRHQTAETAVRVDPAVRAARAVVGLYGDPDVSWGIAVELEFSKPQQVALFDERLALLCGTYPHLGRPPTVAHIGEEGWEAHRDAEAARPFGDTEPLLRVAVTPSGTRLLVGVHHGACDGLGLLAVADALTGAGFVSRARGIGERTSPYPFLLASLIRLREALLTPPARFGGAAPREPGSGEQLVARRLPVRAAGTAELCAAVARALGSWEPGAGILPRRPVLAIGASRRVAGTLVPDRRTAFLRVPFRVDWTVSRFKEELAALEPEPAFPETSAGGVGPWVTRLLRRRLGSTAVLSNLGVVTASDLVSVVMYPAASGPRAVAVGCASTGSVTTVSLRTRRAEFSRRDAEGLLAALADALRPASQ